VTVRERSRRPPPHETEHALHVLHTLTTQSCGHGCVLHAVASLSGGQSAALVTIVRERDCVPPPHDTVHGDHADHCVTEHVHTPKLHACVSLSASHAAPLLAGATTTLRVRRESPGPHICEQAPHVVHALSWQSIGHAAGAHASLSLSGGHEAPLHCASVVTVRVCVRVPLPHVTEHDDHVDQPLTTHDTGQQPKPQLDVSESSGQAAPPLAGCTVTVRVRVLVADVPHVAEHAPHALHSDTSQCTGGGGHAPSEHACWSLAEPVHGPPHDAGVVMLRVRVWVPLSQVTEHADHAVYADHTQLLGQQPPLAVHTSLSLSTSHVPPHDSGVTTERAREREPLPHDTEHGDHAAHAVSTQLAAQHAPPHASDSNSVVGQVVPPQLAPTAIERMRERMPPPHVAEHALHCVH
jgi:hypothetical protein